MDQQHPMTTELPTPTTEGKWSGTQPPPPIGGRILLNYFHKIPGTIKAYQQREQWLHALVEPDALCPELQYRLRPPTSWDAAKALFENERTLWIDTAGAETSPWEFQPTEPNTALEELAVLIAAASLGRNSWKNALQDAWMNGSYHRYPFEFLSGPLQRVRNSGHWKFVEKATKKNPEFIQIARRHLQ